MEDKNEKKDEKVIEGDVTKMKTERGCNGFGSSGV